MQQAMKKVGSHITELHPEAGNRLEGLEWVKR